MLVVTSHIRGLIKGAGYAQSLGEGQNKPLSTPYFLASLAREPEKQPFNQWSVQEYREEVEHC